MIRPVVNASSPLIIDNDEVVASVPSRVGARLVRKSTNTYLMHRGFDLEHLLFLQAPKVFKRPHEKCKKWKSTLLGTKRILRKETKEGIEENG